MKRLARCSRALSLLALLVLLAACGAGETVLEDDYEYLIGVSLSNVMEPWLSQTIDGMTNSRLDGSRVNLIFKDAAGSTEKQRQDIDQLMECGVDLLVVAPGDSESLREKLREVYREIPVVALGIDPGVSDYTSFIESNDYEIGRLAGNYILETHYRPGSEIVVVEGLPDSPLSARRLEGFQETVSDRIAREDLHFLNGEWLRDKAENRMKDYLVTNRKADIVFAFNDEMAYGAYLAYDQYRVTGICFIGVDGFSGNMGGEELVARGILTATIQCPELGSLAYETAVRILNGEDVEKHQVAEPKIITAADIDAA